MDDIFYNRTVTVYNRYMEGLMEKEIWLPTVLHSVRILITKGANVRTSGMEKADSAKLSVRPEYLPDGLYYTEPLKWRRMDRQEKERHFTFASGDFFVEGDTTAEDTTREGFFQYMKKKYDNCFRITNTDTYGLIPHWEVGGE